MVYKGLRVDEETLAAVDALREEGETESACLRRVLAAGVAALNDPGGGIDGLNARVDALAIEIERLAAEVEELARPRRRRGWFGGKGAGNGEHMEQGVK